MKKTTLSFLFIFSCLIAFCQVPLPYSYDFDGAATLTDGWSVIHGDPSSLNSDPSFTGVTDAFINPYSAPNVWSFTSGFTATDYNQYLVSPRIVNSTNDSIRLSFKYFSENDEWVYAHTETFRIGYVTANTYASPSDFQWQTETVEALEAAWQNFEVNLPADAQYVVIDYNVTSPQLFLYLDNIQLSTAAAEDYWPIIVNANAGGTVTPASTSVQTGSDLDFQVSANEGYRIVSVQLDGETLAGSVNVDSFAFTLSDIVAAHTVTVTFAILEYSISIVSGVGGTVIPDGGQIRQILVPWATDTVFRFMPDSGYHVNDVLIDNYLHLGSVSSYTFTNVRENHSIYVTFALNEFTIVATAGAGGTISPSGSVPVQLGNDITFTIIPSTGYLIDTVWVDGVALSEVNHQGYIYTFSEVDADHTISAAFARQSYLVCAVHSAGGELEIVGGSSVGQDSVRVLYGDSLVFNLLPELGYVVDDILLDGVSVGADNPYILRNIAASHMVRVSFTPLSFSIAATAYGNGSLAPLSVTDVPYLDTATFILSPSHCVRVDSIKLDGGHLPVSDTLKLTRLNGNHFLQVFFGTIYYTATALAAEHGTLSCNPRYSCGGTAVINMVPEDCYQATHFYVNGIQRDDLIRGSLGAVYAIISSVSENMTFSADFERITYNISVSDNGFGTINQGSGVVDCGTSLHFEIIPNECYYVDNLSINGRSARDLAIWSPCVGEGFGDTVSFDLNNIAQDYTIVVTYRQFKDTVVTSLVGPGSISPSSYLNCGDSQQFTISPAPCYSITQITFDGVSILDEVEWNGNTAVCSVDAIHSNHTLSAVTEFDTYLIDVESALNGTVTPSQDSVVDCGQSMEFTFVPDNCYTLDTVWLDGTPINDLLTYRRNTNATTGDSAFYSLMNILTPHIITTSFIPITYSLTTTVYQGYGEIASNVEDNRVTCSEPVLLTITPSDCQYIRTVYYNGDYFYDYSLDGQGVATISVPFAHENMAFGVSFADIFHTIATLPAENGYISAEQSVRCGDSTTLRFRPYACYHLDSIRVNDQVILADGFETEGLESLYTVENVREDLNVSAFYSEDTQHFVSTAGEPLSITDTLVPCGTTLNVYFMMDECHTIDHYVMNGRTYADASQLGELTRVGDTCWLELFVDTDVDFAVFTTRLSQNVNILTNGHGTYTFGDHQTSIFCGDTLEVELSPEACYGVAAIVVNGILLPEWNDSLLIINDVTQDLNIHITFEVLQFDVDVVSNEWGHVLAPTIGLYCGDTASFSFIPADCARLDSVWVDGECVNSQLDTLAGNITAFVFEGLSSSHVLRAHFSEINYDVVVRADENVIVNVPEISQVPCGEDFEISILTDDCHFISHFIVDGAETFELSHRGDTVLFQLPHVNADHLIEIVSSSFYYPLGIQFVTQDEVLFERWDSIACGTDTTLSAIWTDDCYVVDSVMINNDVQPLQDTYQVEIVSGEVKFSVFMHRQFFTVDCLLADHCEVSPGPSSTFSCGDTVRCHFNVEEGYFIENLIIDGDTIPGADYYVFENLHADHTVSVVVGHYTYEIVTSCGPNGSVTPATLIAEYGETVEVVFTPDPCYQVDSVWIDGEYVGDDSAYTLGYIHASHSVHATFKMRNVRVKVLVEDSLYGTATNLGEHLLSCGSAFSTSIFPADCSRLRRVFVNNVDGDSLLQIVDDHFVLNFDSLVEDTSVRILFEPIRYTCTANANFGGTVSPMFIQPLCGSNVTFEIDPLDCYEIDSVWLNDSLIEISSLIFDDDLDVYTYSLANIREDCRLRVHFRGILYQLQVENNGQGQVVLGQSGMNCAGTVSFTIIPSACERISEVYVNDMNVTELLEFHPNVNPHLPDTAVYTINALTENVVFRVDYAPVVDKQIVVLFNSDTEILLSDTMNVACGSDVQIPLSWNCHHLDSLIVDDEISELVDSYSFTSIFSNHTLRAVFSVNEYTVTSQPAQNGQISPLGDSIVICGQSITYDIVPNEGYDLDALFVDGERVAPTSSYSFENVVGNHTIRPLFSILEYRITASSNEGGAVSPESIIVEYGSDVTVSIAPDECHHLDSLIVDGQSMTLSSSYIFTNVTDNHDLRAVFAMNEFLITASTAENGQITPSGASAVNCGESITYNIIPNAGYYLDSLYVDGESVIPVLSYTFSNVVENHNIRPVFAIYEYQITAVSNAGGAVSLSSSNVQYGGQVTVDIIPDDCYHLDSLIVDGQSVALSESYTFAHVTGDHDLRAVFAIDEYTVNAVAVQNGQISPVGESIVNCGESIAYTITPNDGYHLESLLVDGVSVTPTLTYTFENVNANHTILPTFALNRYRIVSSANFGGSVSPMLTTVPYGGNTTITISPRNCYHLDSLFVDGVSVELSGAYTFSDISEDHTLRAVFAISSYTVVAEDAENGFISPSGSTSVTCGESISYDISPNEGYHLDSLFVDGSSVAPTPTYTFSNVVENHTIRPVFALDEFQVAASAGVGGSVAPTSQMVGFGGEATISIAADNCYHLDSLIVDGRSVELADSYTFTNVTENHTLHAVFALETFTITAISAANGEISPTGESVVNCGESIAYTITPNEGYYLDSLFVDGESVSPTLTFTFTNIAENHTIRPHFDRYEFLISAIAGEGGSVSPTFANISQGEDLTVMIVPQECYHIASLFVDGQSVEVSDSYTFSDIDENHTLRAAFAINQYALTALPAANGQITPSGVTNINCDGSLVYNITPNEGYYLDSLFVDGESVAPVGTYVFNNIVDNHVIRPVFSLVEYQIVSSAGEGGQILPTIAEVAHGASATIHIAADECYHLTSLVVDGQSVEVSDTYTFTNVTENHTLRATFAVDQFTISAIASANGSISPTGNRIVNCGESVVYTFTPNEGYYLSGLLVDGENVAPSPTFTFENIDSDHSIRPIFSVYRYQITASAGMGGTVTPVTTTISHGSDATVSIAPNDCYHLDSLIVDGQIVALADTYTFTNVTENHTLRAVFGLDVFTITAISAANGEISPVGESTVNCGETITYSITPDEGYYLDSLLVDGLRVTPMASYTFTDVSESHTIRPVFAIYEYQIAASATDGGSVSPASAIVEYGSDATVSISANDCYHLDSLIVDGQIVALADTYTFTNVTENHTLRAVFALDTFSASLSVYLDGELSFGDEISVGCGEDIQLEIPQFACSQMDSLFVNGRLADTTFLYEIFDVHSDYQVVAFFSSISYQVIVTTQGQGSVTPSDTVQVVCGENQTFTFVPDANWFTQEILLDGVSLGMPANDSYTLVDIVGDHTLEVIFAINQYMITSSVDPIDAGNITPNGSHIYEAGETVTYTIMPFPDYRIRDVEVDGVSVGNSSTYVFENLDDNHTIIAYFESTGIEDAAWENISVYAIGNTVYIRNESLVEIRQIEVYDAQGRRIAKRVGASGSQRFDVNVSDGIYIVRLVTKDGIRNHKVWLHRE